MKILKYYTIILINILFGYNLFAQSGIDSYLDDAIVHISQDSKPKDTIHFEIVKQLYLNIQDNDTAEIAADKIKERFKKDVSSLKRYPQMREEDIKNAVRETITNNTVLLGDSKIECKIKK